MLMLYSVSGDATYRKDVFRMAEFLEKELNQWAVTFDQFPSEDRSWTERISSYHLHC